MAYNFNKLSGILAIYFLAGATASFPASFIFKGNGDGVSGSIFLILGAVFLAIGSIAMYANFRASSESELSDNSRQQTMYIIFVLTVITAVVMFILGETVRF